MARSLMNESNSKAIGPSSSSAYPAMNNNHYLNHGYGYSTGSKGQQDKTGKSKVQRGRQLQVSDLDW
jgi:hypothetical protein